MPTSSQWLAAYAAAATTAGGQLAQKLMDEPDLAAADEAVFPTIVQTLFAADLAREARAVAPNARGEGPGGMATTGGEIPACASMQDFVNGVVEDVLTALIQAMPEEVGPTIPEIFDYAQEKDPDLVKTFENAGIAFLVRELRRAAVVLAIASEIASLARAWSVKIDAAPGATRFGVDEEIVEGSVTARLDFGGLTEWPPDLVSCAAAAGVPLPPLTGKGEPVTWETTESPVSLIERGQESAEIDGDGEASLAYVTNTESRAAAEEGAERTGRLIVKATVERTNLEALRVLLVEAFYARMGTNPVILAAFNEWALPTLIDAFAPLTRVTGTGIVPVVYHDLEKETSVTTTTTAIGTDKRLVGTWNVADLTGLLDAVEANLDFGVAPIDFVYQSGTELFTFFPDGTVEVVASGFTVGGQIESEAGTVQAVMIFDGRATGHYAADGTTLSLSLTGDTFSGVVSVTMMGVVNTIEATNATNRFLPQGSIPYTVAGNQLELLTNPVAGVPVVLTRVR
jgi:hypothetical protein